MEITVIHLRRIFLAMVVIAGFIFALSPPHHTGDEGEARARFISAAASASHYSGGATVAGAHGHADIDACADKAGHCVPAAPFVAAGNHGFFGTSLTRLPQRFGTVLRGGLLPLPLLPPPELA